METSPTRRITLLVDYKGEYFPRHKHRSDKTDLERFGRRLAERRYDLRVRHFSEIDFRGEDFGGELVLYQSSQDPGLHYKSYIEDVVLGLHLQGAHLIPGFPLLRAHHNKVFMEILRDLQPIPELKSLKSRHFGTYQELAREADGLEYPAVLKPAAGDCSRGVSLLRNADDARRLARRQSASFSFKDAWDNLRRRITAPRIVAASLHRKKFVIQTFIPGLDHDWKVLALGDKFFVANRTVRADDFRASGAPWPMRFPAELPPGLLDFAERVYRSFKVPFASIDVMHDGQSFHVGEVQFVRFGTTVLVRNPRHWVRSEAGSWEAHQGSAEWERVLATAVADYADERLEVDSSTGRDVGISRSTAL